MVCFVFSKSPFLYLFLYNSIPIDRVLKHSRGAAAKKALCIRDSIAKALQLYKTASHVFYHFANPPQNFSNLNIESQDLFELLHFKNLNIVFVCFLDMKRWITWKPIRPANCCLVRIHICTIYFSLDKDNKWWSRNMK